MHQKDISSSSWHMPRKHVGCHPLTNAMKLFSCGMVRFSFHCFIWAWLLLSTNEMSCFCFWFIHAPEMINCVPWPALLRCVDSHIVCGRLTDHRTPSCWLLCSVCVFFTSSTSWRIHSIHCTLVSMTNKPTAASPETFASTLLVTRMIGSVSSERPVAEVIHTIFVDWGWWWWMYISSAENNSAIVDVIIDADIGRNTCPRTSNDAKGRWWSCDVMIGWTLGP